MHWLSVPPRWRLGFLKKNGEHWILNGHKCRARLKGEVMSVRKALWLMDGGEECETVRPTCGMGMCARPDHCEPGSKYAPYERVVAIVNAEDAVMCKEVLERKGYQYEVDHTEDGIRFIWSECSLQHFKKALQELQQ